MYDRKGAKSGGKKQNRTQTARAEVGSLAQERQQKRATAQKERQTEKKQKQYNAYAQQKQKTEKKKKKALPFIIAAVVMVLLSEADNIAELADKLTVKTKEVTRSEPVLEYYGIQDGTVLDSQMYEYVRSIMDSEGENFEIQLYSGEYVGGCQLPEGIYTASTLGVNGLQVDDMQNSIFLSYSMGGENDAGTELSNIRIYEGARVKIEGDGALVLRTENAKLSSMREPKENPNTEVFELKETKVYRAGQDFTPGTYDLEMDGGNCSVRIRYSEDNTEYISLDYDGGYGIGSGYRNVCLKEGTELEISYMFDEDAQLRLVPSQVIYDEVTAVENWDEE